MKAKSFSSNLVIPLVFNTLKGFDEYPTRFYNMKENDWFGGSGVSRYLPEYPDEKFNASSFFEKLENDSSFKEKVDISWKNYLDTTYKKYHAIMSTMNAIHQSTDINSFDESNTQRIMEDFIQEDSNLMNDQQQMLYNTATFTPENNTLVNVPTFNELEGSI